MRLNFKKIISRQPKMLRMFQLFGSYAWQPFFLLLHITFKCNGSCPQCYQRHDAFYQPFKNLELNYRNFKKILKHAKRSFLIMPKIHLFGGEPLLHPKFHEFLVICQAFGAKASVTTNGFLLEEYIDVFLPKYIEQVNISIDGLAKLHNSSRGLPDGFEKIISGIKHLKAHGKSLKKKQIIININCLISPHNYKDLIKIAFYFHNNNIPIDSLSFQHMYFYNRMNSRFDFNSLCFQLKKLMSIKANFPILITPKIKLEDLKNYYFGNMAGFKSNCYLPWLGLNILPDLRVTPAGGVFGCNRFIGDLNRQTIKEIWHGENLRKFRQSILENGLSASCRNCCHRQYY